MTRELHQFFLNPLRRPFLDTKKNDCTVCDGNWNLMLRSALQKTPKPSGKTREISPDLHSMGASPILTRAPFVRVNASTRAGFFATRDAARKSSTTRDDRAFEHRGNREDRCVRVALFSDSAQGT